MLVYLLVIGHIMSTTSVLSYWSFKHF